MIVWYNPHGIKRIEKLNWTEIIGWDVFIYSHSLENISLSYYGIFYLNLQEDMVSAKLFMLVCIALLHTL